MSRVQLTPGALAKLRRFVEQADALRRHAGDISDQRRRRINERTEARREIEKIERELREGRGYVPLRNDSDRAFADGYVSGRTRELEEHRTRLAIIETDLKDLDTREAQYAAQRSWLASLCDRLIEASGQFDVRAQLEGRR